MTTTLVLLAAALAGGTHAASAAHHEVLVVYYSKSGHTRLLAEAIGAGAQGNATDSWHATTTARL